MTLEILAILAAVGIPSVSVIVWRAGINKLDERYMPKAEFTKLYSEIGDEMASVRTLMQTEMRKWEVIDEKVATLISDERHRDVKLERMEAQLTSVTAQLHKLEIDQLKGFSALKDEIRDHVNTSMARALEEIRNIVDRKI